VLFRSPFFRLFPSCVRASCATPLCCVGVGWEGVLFVCFACVFGLVLVLEWSVH
jgi:hypothetical protein